MKKRIFSILLLGLSATAQAASETTEYDRMIAEVANARSRIVIYAPSIFDVKLANQIRRAHVDYIRKVKVTILTIPYYNTLGDSTTSSLVIAGVPVFERQIKPSVAFMIVDGKGWMGNDLGKFEKAGVRRMSSTEINKSLEWTRSALTGAKPISPLEAFDRLERIIQ